jgi:hypothetical protein
MRLAIRNLAVRLELRNDRRMAVRQNLAADSLKTLATERRGARTQGKMTRAAALLLLLLPAACAETQSARAFAFRPAAVTDIAVTTPNTSAERNRDLAQSLDRSLQVQEEHEQWVLQEMVPAKAPDSPVPAKADHGPVATTYR